MNIRAAALAALLWSVSLTGCTSLLHLEVAPDSVIQPVIEGGVPSLRSRQRYEVIVRRLTDWFTLRTAEFPALLLAVVNRTNTPVDFSVANITARSGNNNVEVYWFESYRNRARLESLLYATGTVDETANGGLEAVARANLSSSPILDLNAPVEINGQMLRAYSIPPGQFAGGVVRLHAPSIYGRRPLVIRVDLDGDVHEFRFAVHRRGSHCRSYCQIEKIQLNNPD